MESCPLTNLWLYMPLKFKAMKKPAFLIDIHQEEDKETIVIPSFIHSKSTYKFLSDS